MTNETFIEEHREQDVRQLALANPPDGIDIKWCLQQIEGWQIACRKLPQWSRTKGLHYPPRLSMEQCSSEQTALYKRSIIERILPPDERQRMADLTGGLGVDFSYMAPLFQQATYVEIQPELCDLARHNMPLLGIHNSQFIIHNNPSSLTLFIEPAPTRHNSSHFSSLTLPFSFIYIDPARRDTSGHKTIRIADCTPNLIECQDTLLDHAHWVMVKLSPMLDIHQALKELKDVHEVHVISVGNECKELLFLCSRKVKADHITYHCVNLGTENEEVVTTKESFDLTYASRPLTYLYEPNASILKAQVQDGLSEQYGVQKLHPQSHLFTGDVLIPHFPGRVFQVVDWSDFGKKNLKALIGDLQQANLTTRNFPTPVATLRRQLHLAEGGDTYLFATTLSNGQHILIRCTKA
ncbi:MAG: hypothetical protein J6Y39_04460 [Bacteroidaceae bacterium]|nr:hypothetical protein [Bacteroidaceae bacterium]